MNDMNELLKQVQEMQKQVQKSQEELEREERTGEAGAGLVKVTMNGRNEVTKVELDEALLGEEREIVEDLIAAAVNDATEKVEANRKRQFAGLMGGLNLPPGFKPPF